MQGPVNDTFKNDDLATLFLSSQGRSHTYALFGSRVAAVLTRNLYSR